MKKTLPLIDGRGSIFDVRSHLFHDTGGVYPVQDSKTDSPKDGGNCGGRSGAFRRKRIRTQDRISHSWRNHLRRACGNLLSGEKRKSKFLINKTQAELYFAKSNKMHRYFYNYMPKIKKCQYFIEKTVFHTPPRLWNTIAEASCLPDLPTK